MKNIALVMAAGSGRRCESATPKQYQKLAGKALLLHTIETFINHPKISAIQVVIGHEHNKLYEQLNIAGLLPPVHGGQTRQQSVFNGLQALSSLNPEHVLIHDAARPCVSTKLIDEVLVLLEQYEAVDVAIPLKDTIKSYDDLAMHVDRNKLYATQTPQGFKYRKVLSWHQQYQNQEFTDDISLAIKAGAKIGLAKGEAMNFKITTMEDMILAEKLLQNTYHTRIGFGYDVHKIELVVNGSNTIPIAGVNIPSEYRVIAHSDGDVAIHAIMDALLGTISAGDIGHHFPPDDNKYKGMDSKQLLAKVKNILDKHNAIIINIDCTIVAETPKIKNFIPEMKNILASIVSLAQDQISIKATTSEGLGFIGNKEGIAAHAVCSVKVPSNEISQKI